MLQAGRDVCDGLEIGVDTDQLLEGGARYSRQAADGEEDVGDHHDRAEKHRRTQASIMTTTTDGYVIRRGKRIAVTTIEPKVAPRRRRRPFEPKWVEPRNWMTALLNTKSVSTYHLAHLILWEAFKREHVGGEVILSAKVTKGVPRNSKIRAAEELVKLGLIQIERNGHQAIKVIHIY